MNENNKMKREEVGMLKLLRGGVENSSRGILSAWRHPSAFLHVLLLQGDTRMALGFLLLQGEDALSLFSGWNGD